MSKWFFFVLDTIEFYVVFGIMENHSLSSHHGIKTSFIIYDTDKERFTTIEVLLGVIHVQMFGKFMSNNRVFYGVG